MKVITHIILILISGQYSYSQTKSNAYKNMLDSAIVLQINQLGIDEIYLINESYQPYILSSEYQEKFKHIDIYDLKNRKILKKGIMAWKIFPVLENNRLVVNIIDFKIIYKDKNYNFANGGGAKVVFEYSCKENTWVLIESKWRGI